MTAAYLIIAHRDPPMFHRLVAALPADAAVYAHINAQVNEEPFKVGCPSVTFLAERLTPDWYSWAMVEVTARLLELALADASVTRCTLLSGQCYPILTPSALATWQAEPVDHLEIVSAPNPAWGKHAWRFERRWSGSGYRDSHPLFVHASIELNRRFGRRIDPSIALNGRGLYAGSGWWSFTRPTAERARCTSPATTTL